MLLDPISRLVFLLYDTEKSIITLNFTEDGKVTRLLKQSIDHHGLHNFIIPEKQVLITNEVDSKNIFVVDYSKVIEGENMKFKRFNLGIQGFSKEILYMDYLEQTEEIMVFSKNHIAVYEVLQRQKFITTTNLLNL